MAGRESVGRSVGRIIADDPRLRTFVIIDAVLVVTFVVLLAMQLMAGGGEAPAPPEAEPTGSTSDPAEPETTPEATAPAAPDENQGLTEFLLPSRNIWCTMTETSATCTIRSYSFTPPEDETCDGEVGPVLTVTAGEGASMPCVTTPPPAPEGAAVLDYGEASTIGEMTCHSSRNGATCRHDPTGEGFSVARAGYTFL